MFRGLFRLTFFLPYTERESAKAHCRCRKYKSHKAVRLRERRKQKCPLQAKAQIRRTEFSLISYSASLILHAGGSHGFDNSGLGKQKYQDGYRHHNYGYCGSDSGSGYTRSRNLSHSIGKCFIYFFINVRSCAYAPKRLDIQQNHGKPGRAYIRHNNVPKYSSSKRASGSWSMNCFIRNIPSGAPIAGKIKDQYVSIQCSLDIVT